MEVHYSSKSNEWETPEILFNKLNDEYNFTLDPCCTKDNAKCEKYYSIEDDGITKSWKGEVVFMNPPYGRVIGKWIEKAYSESVDNGVTVVCLIPSRTDTIWWHNYCMKGRITFLKGRLKFINRALPSWNAEGKYKVSPAPFPSAIVIFKGK